jgi:hypothetical protein
MTKRSEYEIVITPVRTEMGDKLAGYVAELWRRPFRGQLLARTNVLRSTRQLAGKDAKRYLRIP